MSNWRWSVWECGWQLSDVTLLARLLAQPNGAITDVTRPEDGASLFVSDPLFSGSFLTTIWGIPPRPDLPFPHGMITEPDVPV